VYWHFLCLGPTSGVLDYFANLGYKCPANMDTADFLQELATAEGRRFTKGNRTAAGKSPPVGTAALVRAWKNAELCTAMIADMDQQRVSSVREWSTVYKEYYPGSFWFSFKHCLHRQYKMTIRDTAFLKGRIMQALVVAAIAGSLFSDLPVEDSSTMSGILFFSALFGALTAMALLSSIFDQRAVFYKQSRALFFPTRAYVLAQTVVMYPLQIIETVLFTSIIYWSVGLSGHTDGSRYFTYMFVVFIFTLTVSQFFRMLASVLPSPIEAQPLAGITTVLMVLFSGFITPAKNIPPGWIWFYWINPIAYVLKGVTVNEFLAPDYDFPVCLNADCSRSQRFGDLVLESRGNPTEQKWVWYSVAIMLGIYAVFFSLSVFGMTFLRLEPVPPPPINVKEEAENAASEKASSSGASSPTAAGAKEDAAPIAAAVTEGVRAAFSIAAPGSNNDEADEVDETESSPALGGGGGDAASGAVPASPVSPVSQASSKNNAPAMMDIPFEPVTFAFKDIWYTIKIRQNEELDLLRGVSGYFEPGTITALVSVCDLFYLFFIILKHYVCCFFYCLVFHY
jgi:ABC-type multidrug transport system permease subunit